MLLAFGLSAVVLLILSVVLWLSRAELATELSKLKDAESLARRDSQNATKKLEDQQKKYDKSATDLATAQQQVKDLKQQLHNKRDELKRRKRHGDEGSEKQLQDEQQQRRAMARLEELEGLHKELRSKNKELAAQLVDKQAESKSLTDRITRVAAEEGGVSEEEVLNAVQEAKRTAAQEVRRELVSQHKSDSQRLHDRIRSMTRDAAQREVAVRRLGARYEDAHRAYAITQGQLEMATDRFSIWKRAPIADPTRPMLWPQQKCRTTIPDPSHRCWTKTPTIRK